MKIANVVPLLCVIMLFTAGCGGGVGHALVLKNLGKEKVVDRSGGRPDWAFDKPMFVKNGVLYASGMFTDSPNLGKGLEVATKLAQAKLAESIRMRLKDDFSYASEGLSVESTILERILNTTTEEMTIRGFFQTKLYYEKKAAQTTRGISYRYDCFALAEITQENYQQAVDEAIGKNMSSPVSEEFRQKVDERQRLFFRLGDARPIEVEIKNTSDGQTDAGISETTLER